MAFELTCLYALGIQNMYTLMTLHHDVVEVLLMSCCLMALIKHVSEFLLYNILQ